MPGEKREPGEVTTHQHYSCIYSTISTLGTKPRFQVFSLETISGMMMKQASSILEPPADSLNLGNNTRFKNILILLFLSQVQIH